METSAGLMESLAMCNAGACARQIHRNQNVINQGGHPIARIYILSLRFGKRVCKGDGGGGGGRRPRLHAKTMPLFQSHSSEFHDSGNGEM